MKANQPLTFQMIVDQVPALPGLPAGPPIGVLLTHGIGGRDDLPLPLDWAVAGAAVAVAVSFLAAVLLWREPRLDGEQGRPLPAAVARVLDSAGLRRVLAGLGLLVAGWTGVALVFGADNARNPVPWVVYVLLFGPVWRLFNPLRTVHALLNRALDLDRRRGCCRCRRGWGTGPVPRGCWRSPGSNSSHRTTPT